LDLRITEINFHPAENPDHEFIEITNAGTEVADLSGVMFTDGIQYAFANDTILGGGKSLILVVNETAFNARYPGIPVAGTYLGRLRNEGERIALATPTAELFTVIYNN
ncbi:MAG: lamin tail domain-containing protein, partial [Opitutae bacterium]|nr:lamin tail domain-containing protein [Opitutae bacterium]